MRLAGPLRIVALIITMGLTWILVTILLGGPGGGLPRIQQFFTSPENSVTAGVSGELLEARAFDMWAGEEYCLVGKGCSVEPEAPCSVGSSPPDVNDLLKFIRPLHEGTLVFVASYDDPATKMNEETRKLFSELGSRNAKELAFRDSWVFVGAKGVQNKSPFEQHVKNSKHTNKYEGWPEALEMEGCIPRRSMAG
ncbi:protein FAM3A isoform X5 [Peromyscus maniculatus bairdii]|uniref:protein FAM3A isoform X3 n=1 Tax=Peromyscus leucopus TaxID=10041 RepID=UPI0010A175A1|nr:protein FAM3A isoform X3 [Peromyscus leucopus]